MIAIDTHTHSTASGHAYSTVEEIARAAAEKGLPGFVLTDHSPGMPGGPHKYHFYNSRVLPRKIHGTLLFRGIETNIINSLGEIDAEEDLLREMEIVIASIHVPTFPFGSIEDNTGAYVNAVKNPFVKIIGHPDDKRYPYDIPALVQAAGETRTLLEMNNSSLKPNTSRPGGAEIYHKLLAECRRQGVKITVASDAHFSGHVGDVSFCERILEEVKFPRELIANSTLEGFLEETGISL